MLCFSSLGLGISSLLVVFGQYAHGSHVLYSRQAYIVEIGKYRNRSVRAFSGFCVSDGLNPTIVGENVRLPSLLLTPWFRLYLSLPPELIVPYAEVLRVIRRAFKSTHHLLSGSDVICICTP